MLSCDHIWSISIYKSYRSSHLRNCRKYSRDDQISIFRDYLKVCTEPMRMLRGVGTEPFLRNLIRRSQFDFTYLTSTLQPLRLAPAVRDTAAAALMPPSKFNVSRML
jgi:hypothetical protein